jgi:hypothetical protein
MCSYVEEVTVVQQEVMIFCSFVAEVSEEKFLYLNMKYMETSLLNKYSHEKHCNENPNYVFLFWE